jgi:hypothetical protein
MPLNPGPSVPPSIQSQVMARVKTLLDGAGFCAAYRCRMTAFDPSQLPATNILPEDGEPDYLDTDSIDRIFRFKARHIAVAVDEVDAAVDCLYVAGQRALFADPTLGGLVRIIRERSQKWEMEKGSYDSVALAVIYEVEFDTSKKDPSIAGT